MEPQFSPILSTEPLVVGPKRTSSVLVFLLTGTLMLVVLVAAGLLVIINSKNKNKDTQLPPLSFSGTVTQLTKNDNNMYVLRIYSEKEQSFQQFSVSADFPLNTSGQTDIASTKKASDLHKGDFVEGSYRTNKGKQTLVEIFIKEQSKRPIVFSGKVIANSGTSITVEREKSTIVVGIRGPIIVSQKYTISEEGIYSPGVPKNVQDFSLIEVDNAVSVEVDIDYDNEYIARTVSILN